MIVRTARRADAEAVAAIWNGEIREGVSTFTTTEKSASALEAEFAARGDAFVVAESGGEVVGFATYFQFRGGPGYAQTVEYTIHLAPSARGLGVGQQVLTELEARARAAKMHVLVGGISGENATGAAFHKKMGFVEVGRMPEVGQKFGRRMDLVLMQKLL